MDNIVQRKQHAWANFYAGARSAFFARTGQDPEPADVEHWRKGFEESWARVQEIENQN